jgi:hypothetical protein|tara:strand:+ start:163 stop:411 length:249 start_codon:yes stop_codon:yes gene_type:complete
MSDVSQNKTQLKIDKDVPLPNSGTAGYLARRLEIGDSVLIEDEIRATANNRANYLIERAKDHGFRTLKKELGPKSFRVWRIG